MVRNQALRTREKAEPNCRYSFRIHICMYSTSVLDIKFEYFVQCVFIKWQQFKLLGKIDFATFLKSYCGGFTFKSWTFYIWKICSWAGGWLFFKYMAVKQRRVGDNERKLPPLKRFWLSFKMFYRIYLFMMDLPFIHTLYILMSYIYSVSGTIN